MHVSDVMQISTCDAIDACMYDDCNGIVICVTVEFGSYDDNKVTRWD